MPCRCHDDAAAIIEHFDAIFHAADAAAAAARVTLRWPRRHYADYADCFADMPPPMPLFHDAAALRQPRFAAIIPFADD
jgi:hypothetical protein